MEKKKTQKRKGEEGRDGKSREGGWGEKKREAGGREESI